MARVLSVEVGNSITRICEMDYKVKNPKVYKNFSIPTPRGVVEDGFIRENPEFSLSLKRALNDNKIKTKQVVFSVSSSKIVTREVTVPQLKMNQVGNYVKANANDYFPIDLSIYEIAHLVLGVEKAEEGGQGKYRVMVMAAGKDLISGYAQFASSCGLKFVCVDFAGNSVYQIMANECPEGATLVVKVEDSTTIASVIADRTMVLQRTLAYGFERAVNTLMESPEFYESNYAEAFKAMCNKPSIKVALNDRTRIIEKDEVMNESELATEARGKITSTFGQMISNLARVVELYNTKDPLNPIKQVMLVGLGGEIVNLSKLFTNELGIPTQVVKHFTTVSMFQSMDENFVRYAGCMGAVIDPVNLSSQEGKDRGFKKVNYTPLSIAAVAVFAGINIFLVASSVLPLMEEQNRQQDLLAKEEEYKKAEALHDQHIAVGNMRNEVVKKYRMTLNNNDNIIAFLDELELKMPEDASLVEFKSDTNAAFLTIRALDYEETAKILQILRHFDSVYDVTNEDIVEDPIVDEQGNEIAMTYRFQAVCTYYPIVVDEVQVTVSETSAE